MQRFVFVFLCVFICRGVSFAGKLPDLSEALYPELEAVIACIDSDASFSAEDVRGLIHTVRSAAVGSGMRMKDRENATGAFYAFTIPGGLLRITEYAYSPDIPAYITMPSSVRMQQWAKEQQREKLRALPKAVRTNEPFVFRGTESETVTPDVTTGGYYTYTQKRLLFYLPGEETRIFVTASKQEEPSSVGCKGAVVGDNKFWNYLFSGESGLNKTGLGWVKSYMYSGAAVTVYVEDLRKKTVHVGVFKWLRAGWSGMNMVKPGHILDGIARFATDFSAVLGSRHLPEPHELSARYMALQKTGREVLQQQVGSWIKTLVKTKNGAVTSAPFAGLLADGSYVRQVPEEELVRILFVEELKKHLGRIPEDL